MKLNSGKKLGFGAQYAGGDSKLRGYHLVIFGVLTSSLVACASTPDSVKTADRVPSTVAIAAAPPLPEPDELPPEVIMVSVSKPIAPIIANDAVNAEEKKEADRDSNDEAYLAQGGEGGEQAMGGEGSLTTEGNFTGPGGLGIASNARGAHRRAGELHPPPPDGSGASNTGGTQVAATSEVRGSIEKAEIRRVVTAHANEVKRCYEQGLARRPDLEGRIAVKFTIGKTGTVVAATVTESTLNDRQSEQCIVRAATKWVFPKPTGDGLVTVSYPFILKSAD